MNCYLIIFIVLLIIYLNEDQLSNDGFTVFPKEYTNKIGRGLLKNPNASNILFKIREQERLKKEKLERMRLEQERLKKERLEQEKLERHRLEQERIKKEQLERQRLEQEQLERQRLEQERIEHEQLEQKKREAEQLEELKKSILQDELELQKKERKGSFCVIL